MSSLDSIAILPFRLLAEPVTAFWLGSAILALVSLLLGQSTVKIAMYANGAFLNQHVQDARKFENTYLGMLKNGEARHDRSGVNGLANEAFGKAFFMGISISAASLWPVFFAAGWIDSRFTGIRLPLTGFENGLSNVAPLVITYIALYIVYANAIKSLGKSGYGRTQCRI